jgi:glutathione peroxidase-family protein
MMRVKRVAYNEYVDEYGNVRKSNVSRGNSHPIYKFIEATITLIAHVVWWALKAFWKVLKTGWKKFKEA